MPLMINTNVASLNSQRQLLHSGNDLDQAMERLSSGKRVNNAADDAAGLAIANRMTSQIMGLNQSIRNANDGISMIQTAEGALDETTNILQRMRELAIQAANGIYSDADRSTLDAEVQQLKAEMDRIAESTTFNGQPLLDGSQEDVTLQVGSEAADTISYSITAMDTDTLGGSSKGDIIGTVTTAADLLTGLQFIDNGTVATNNAVMSVNGQSVGDLTGASTLQEALDTMNANVSGVEIDAITELVAANDGTGIIRGSDFLQIAVESPDNVTTTFQITDTGSMTELVEKINTEAGGQITASLSDVGRLILASDNGSQIFVTDNNAGDASGITTNADVTQNAQLTFTITDDSITDIDVSFTLNGTDTATVIGNAVGVQARTDGDITGYVNSTQNNLVEGDLILNGVEIGAVTAGGSATLQGDALVTAINLLSNDHGIVATNNAGVLTLNSISGDEIIIEYGDAAAATITTDTGLLETNISLTQGNAISDVDISTVDGAQSSLNIIDVALEEINAIRADLGAVNNRLDFTISNLANVVENTEASRSRILDADFAAETAALSRAQVLQQASQAMLAQANARPQQVLQLLQG